MPKTYTKRRRPIHPDAQLQQLAWNMIVVAIKDIAKPKLTKFYTNADYEQTVDEILDWIGTKHFYAVCLVAGLNPGKVRGIIEQASGITPDFIHNGMPYSV